MSNIPPPPVTLPPPQKKTFPKVEVKTTQTDLQTLLESKKIQVNTSSNFATQTEEKRSMILPNSGISLKVVWGDLTKETTDAIVNAANTNMLHIGGLAKIIVMKGGNNDSIQTESLSNISKQGFKNHVPAGECIYTSGARLPCKYVIHAVGPMWFGGEKNEFDQLKSCIINIFKIATQLGLESVAIPAISTGIYGFPLEKYSEIVFTIIIDIFENQRPETKIKEIRLTNIDEKTMSTICYDFDHFFKK